MGGNPSSQRKPIQSNIQTRNPAEKEFQSRSFITLLTKSYDSLLFLFVKKKEEEVTVG